MQFTDDELETIKALIEDHGADYGLSADFNKVWELGVKLGIREPILPPTEEELKRREEFKNSPLGLEMSELFKQSNEYLAKLETKYDFDFMRDVQWGTKTIKPSDILNL